MSTQEDAQSCDLFVYAAVQLALDRVGEEMERDHLDQGRLALSSVVTGRYSHSKSASEDLEVTQVRISYDS